MRVVNNVVKRNDVRSRLYAAVKGEGYPEAFLYKQKVRKGARDCQGALQGRFCHRVRGSKGFARVLCGVGFGMGRFAKHSNAHRLIALPCCGLFVPPPQVILLFQNVDGVDLCLYCLYMQASCLDAVLLGWGPCTAGCCGTLRRRAHSAGLWAGLSPSVAGSSRLYAGCCIVRWLALPLKASTWFVPAGVWRGCAAAQPQVR